MPQEYGDQIQNLLDQVGEKKGSGKYLDQLDETAREVLDEFESWLKSSDPNGMKSESTARAYKGYVAKAIVELTKDINYELDTDVKSAINALHRFQQATKPEVWDAGDPPESSLDDDDDLIED
jgi:hypothetical protein